MTDLQKDQLIQIRLGVCLKKSFLQVAINDNNGGAEKKLNKYPIFFPIRSEIYELF